MIEKLHNTEIKNGEKFEVITEQLTRAETNQEWIQQNQKRMLAALGRIENGR